jgi:hypothetical protein
MTLSFSAIFCFRTRANLILAGSPIYSSNFNRQQSLKPTGMSGGLDP